MKGSTAETLLDSEAESVGCGGGTLSVAGCECVAVGLGVAAPATVAVGCCSTERERLLVARECVGDVVAASVAVLGARGEAESDASRDAVSDIFLLSVAVLAVVG